VTRGIGGDLKDLRGDFVGCTSERQGFSLGTLMVTDVNFQGYP
jgi:hypothetical protein